MKDRTREQSWCGLILSNYLSIIMKEVKISNVACCYATTVSRIKSSSAQS